MSENKNIKMTLADGTVIEGTAEELAKLQKLFPAENGADNIEESEESLVGKYVIFTDTDGADLTAGKAYEIKYEYGDCLDIIDDIGETQTVFKDEQDSRFAYEIVDEIPELQVGDKVKLVIADGKKPEFGWGGVSNGDVGVVKSISVEIISVNFPKQVGWMALRSELVITDEEFEVFNEGDYAKVIGNTHFGDAEEGDIVKIISDVAYSEGNYKIELLDGSDYDYAKSSSLEKVELSELDLLFVKNGREIGEFKEGDIAEVLVDVSGSPIGSIVEVQKVNKGSVVAKGVSTALGEVYSGYLYEPKHLKLVALAENRADTIA